jgi:hypothetical protein
MFTRVGCLKLCWASLIHFKLYKPTSLVFILILSSHIRQKLQSDLFTWLFRTALSFTSTPRAFDSPPMNTLTLFDDHKLRGSSWGVSSVFRFLGAVTSLGTLFSKGEAPSYTVHITNTLREAQNVILREVSAIHWTVLSRARHWSLSRAGCIQSTVTHPVSLKHFNIIIKYSPLPGGVSIHVLRPNFVTVFHLPCVPHVPLILSFFRCSSRSSVSVEHLTGPYMSVAFYL